MCSQNRREKDVWEIVELLNIYSRKIRSYNNTARFYGTDEKLFLSESHTIHHIGEHQGISMNKLAEITQRTKGATSSMVESLIQKGYIVKHRDTADQRRVKLALTPKGQKVYSYHEQLDRKNYSSISDKSSELTDNELAIANKVIRKVVKELFKD